MTDATSRAREVILELLMRFNWPDGSYPDKIDVLQFVLDMECQGVGVYDTRTHAAIPREPSDEVVERVADRLMSEVDTVEMLLADPMTIRRIRAKRIARAAIAALVQGQTQGGGREDV